MTDTYVRDIVYISKTTGDIIRIDMAPINYPGEGTDPENSNLFIKHLQSTWVWPVHTQNGIEFMEKYYWNFDSLSWTYRGPKPNAYAFWTRDKTWDWDSEAFLNGVRVERNIKLSGTDWTQVADAPITSEQVTEARTYRQALRDMTIAMLANPENYSTSASIPWPTVPDFLA